jgi:hypothetical protein
MVGGSVNRASFRQPCELFEPGIEGSDTSSRSHGVLHRLSGLLQLFLVVIGLTDQAGGSQDRDVSSDRVSAQLGSVLLPGVLGDARWRFWQGHGW